MTRTYGFIITRETSYGAEYLKARVVCREDDADSPINPRSAGESTIWDAPKAHDGFNYESLSLIAHLYADSSDGPCLIGPHLEFRDPFAVGLLRVKQMAKTLTKAHRGLSAADAREPGDILFAVSTALNFSFVVVERENKPGGSYRDSKWRWMTIGEGRNHFRRLAESMIVEAKAAAATDDR